jgi:hypothetical protein
VRRPRRTPPLLALAALAAAGCGQGERVFSAPELIEQVNANGAGLELGESLETAREGAEVREVAFVEPGEPRDDETAQHEHGGGTLTITTDAEAGLAEYERCESAATLLCFRASNVVLVFEADLDPADRTRLEGALRAMASEE